MLDLVTLLCVLPLVWCRPTPRNDRAAAHSIPLLGRYAVAGRGMDPMRLTQGRFDISDVHHRRVNADTCLVLTWRRERFTMEGEQCYRVQNSLFAHLSSSDNGGAIYQCESAGSLYVLDTSFLTCGSRMGGGICSFGGAVSELEVLRSCFEDCYANWGLATETDRDTGLRIQDSNFYSCSRTGAGDRKSVV
jgi:hypothetical protein